MRRIKKNHSRSNLRVLSIVSISHSSQRFTDSRLLFVFVFIQKHLKESCSEVQPDIKKQKLSVTPHPSALCRVTLSHTCDSLTCDCVIDEPAGQTDSVLWLESSLQRLCRIDGRASVRLSAEAGDQVRGQDSADQTSLLRAFLSQAPVCTGALC